MFLAIDQHIIHYERYGNGPVLVCCLPGYGETGQAFRHLAQEMGESYSLVCPDLPLHGQTNWGKAEFGPPELHLVLGALRRKEGFGNNKFGLAGYSMGGRLALAYAQAFPDELNLLVLLAADGLHRNFWYHLATQSAIGKRIFKYTMQNPGWLFIAVKWGRYAGLLHEDIARLSQQQLNDPTQRQLLFDRWILFRNFKPRLPAIKKTLASAPWPTLLVFGAFDRIIPPTGQKKPYRPDNPRITVLVLEAGHRLLKPQFAATIARAIATLRTS